jgi:hypothetical protein
MKKKRHKLQKINTCIGAGVWGEAETGISVTGNS